MMVTPPASVHLTTAAISALVPPLKFSNSKTPAGLTIKAWCQIHRDILNPPIPDYKLSSSHNLGEGYVGLGSTVQPHPALQGAGAGMGVQV